MATHGPRSLLDSREVDETTHVVRDRVTRHRSPARTPKRCNSSENVDYVTSRIDQPYRTSFSAVLPPIRSKRDRSRSTSPSCSSLKSSDRSRSKSPGRRSHPKHVTYDNRVVIRESGTSDSLYTNLSDRDVDRRSANTSMLSSDSSTMAGNSNRDYSSELRELSQQIVQEYSQDSECEANSQVKSSRNEHYKPRSATPNGNMKPTTEQRQDCQRSNEHPQRSYENRQRTHENQQRSYENRQRSYENQQRSSENHQRSHENHQRSYENPQRSHEPRQNGYPRAAESRKPYSDGDVKPKMVVHEDYEHDRSVSYRVAIKNKYSKEIRQKAESMVEEEPPVLEERSPNVKSATSERRHNSSVSLSEEEKLHDHESNRLTPSKRGISASIGNFFRRLSPHLHRRQKKGNLSNASSISLTPSEEMDASHDRRSSFGGLSRSKFRRSMTKLFGGGKSRKSKSPRQENSPSGDTQDGQKHKDNTKAGPVSSVYMKSIEQTSKNDRDIYHKFKDRQSTKSGEVTTPVKPEVRVRVTTPEPDISPDRGRVKCSESEELRTYTPSGKVDPPDSLDVRVVPKSIRSLQASQMSTISMDDSIGDCSIDPNFTETEETTFLVSSSE